MAMMSPYSGDDVSCLINEILTCYWALSELPALDPCPQVDALFGRLILLCRQTPDDATAAKVGVGVRWWMAPAVPL